MMFHPNTGPSEEFTGTRVIYNVPWTTESQDVAGTCLRSDPGTQQQVLEAEVKSTEFPTLDLWHQHLD